MFLLVLYLVISTLAEACNNGEAATKCESANCEMVGTTQICTSCQAGYVPINGKCVTATGNDKCKDTNGSTDADQTCKKCLSTTFMYTGGCYTTAKAPGSTMCTQAANGICTSVAAGNNYFIPLNADASHDSVVACNDTTEITLTKKKKYVGVANCLTCTQPADGNTNTPTAATCTKCADGYFGAACTACAEQCATCEGTNSDSKCKSCKVGYFLGATNNAAGKCIQCDNLEDPSGKGVANCAKCTSSGQSGTAATCTECAANFYLKTDGSTTSCVVAGQCNDGFFPTTDSKNKKVCVKCSATDNGGIADCAKCSLVASSTRAGAAVTCTECTTNKLSPLGDACLAACPAGTYDDKNICKPCHTSCASCESKANQDSGTACYPGSVLNKIESSTAGTCIPECTGRYAENCEANQCTAVLVGSKYCSKCKSGFVPVDGLCVSATARVLAGCTSKGDGTCSACTDKYFLQSGGCYLSTAYPGKTLCSNAADGKCTQCTNTQTADQKTGSFPSCSAGCSKCSGSSDPKTCSECLAGYYLSGTSCVKCSENGTNGSNTITGVKDCVSCAPPATSGPVTCYVTQTPTVDPTDPSVNKTGLSSGAIAGISVAVIVVVGGLVGFLCWWFICRGKA